MPEKLAQVLLDTKREEFQSPLVVVQRGGSHKPFFLLHGDFNGGGFYCLELARHLGVPEAPARSTLAYANEHRRWEVYQRVFEDLLEKCQVAAVGKKTTCSVGLMAARSWRNGRCCAPKSVPVRYATVARLPTAAWIFSRLMELSCCNTSS